MPFVVDASVTLSWHFEDEVSEYADRVLAALGGDEAIVPPIWDLEVTNGLLLAERRHRLSPARVAQAVEDTLALPIMVSQSAPAVALRTVLSLARQHGLTAYDAAYLGLAMQEGLPLATLDRDLRAAAQRTGVALLEPA